jgi:predicted RNase H-like HicB family nuclease
MKFRCTLRQEQGQWVVRHDSPQVGVCQARGKSREEALENMRGELRYRLELCPCTGETYQYLEIELEEA